MTKFMQLFNRLFIIQCAEVASLMMSLWAPPLPGGVASISQVQQFLLPTNWVTCHTWFCSLKSALLLNSAWPGIPTTVNTNDMCRPLGHFPWCDMEKVSLVTRTAASFAFPIKLLKFNVFRLMMDFMSSLRSLCVVSTVKVHIRFTASMTHAQIRVCNLKFPLNVCKD